MTPVEGEVLRKKPDSKISYRLCDGLGNRSLSRGRCKIILKSLGPNNTATGSINKSGLHHCAYLFMANPRPNIPAEPACKTLVFVSLIAAKY